MPGRAAATAVVLIALAGSSAAAQNVCVECRDPERSYRCSVKDADKAQNVRGIGRALEYVCITEIARAGNHQSCRVSTGYSGPCIGHPHEIDLAKLGAEPPAQNAEQAAPPGQAGAAPQATPVKGPPQTLDELARETFAKSKEQISAADEKMRKAGDAVGGSLKRTWDCVASMFSRC